jgi:uncharacterized membrane protein
VRVKGRGLVYDEGSEEALRADVPAGAGVGAGAGTGASAGMGVGEDDSCRAAGVAWGGDGALSEFLCVGKAGFWCTRVRSKGAMPANYQGQNLTIRL